MTFRLDDWHRRFQEQARWTESIRTRWFNQANTSGQARVLEVGCGTGALLSQIPVRPATRLYGLDLQRDRLAFAAPTAPQARLIQADALHLPFPSQAFDIVCCHFLFLWLKDPQAAAREMKRVTRPGGWVMALAEPDYEARIGFPEELARLGMRQSEALQRQGAALDIGRRTAAILAHAGLEVRETCILGGQWFGGREADLTQSEWDVLREDIAENLSAEEWQTTQEIDRQARNSGSRVWFTPTFCVLSIKTVR
jgi:ubiquinone/menaquinone biosynthesis C-methylase UbiE